MKHSGFALFSAALIFMQAVALAQSPPPPTFVYKVNMGAGPGTGSMDYTMDVAVKSTDPDGTRKVTLTLHTTKMKPVDNKPMDATFTPYGSINVGSTGDISSMEHFNPFNMGQAKKAQEASQGPMLQMMLNPMNTFANGFAKAPALKNGATWRAFSNETQANLIYTVTGREQKNGRDTVVVTMQSTPDSMGSVTGQGNYDPVAHLVVAVHCEIKQSADQKNGQIMDVAMANP